jgi:hypothetical protein
VERQLHPLHEAAAEVPLHAAAPGPLLSVLPGSQSPGGRGSSFSQGNVSFKWVPREQNADCDVLSKKVLLDRGIQFRIQPEVPA